MIETRSVTMGIRSMPWDEWIEVRVFQLMSFTFTVLCIEALLETVLMPYSRGFASFARIYDIHIVGPAIC